jgi:hypothetical protein
VVEDSSPGVTALELLAICPQNVLTDLTKEKCKFTLVSLGNITCVTPSRYYMFMGKG